MGGVSFPPTTETAPEREVGSSLFDWDGVTLRRRKL